MPSMLIISFVEWSGAFQRPQHMAVGFARAGWDVTYASPGYIHRGGQQVESGVDLPPNLKVLQPSALPGARKLNVIGKINESALERSIRKSHPGEWDVIIFNDPRWQPLAARLPAAVRAWDNMDDMLGNSPSREWLDTREKETISTVDRIFTGTAMLADRFAGDHPHIRFIPCGVEAERFANPDPAEVESVAREIEELYGDAASAAKSGAPPLAGYFGVLNERFDMSLATALAEEGWRVLLIGPTSSQTERLAPNPLLKWIGPRPYVSLPAYLAAMDLTLIPYRTDGANAFLYPVKALEYLAAAKPVLSTSLPDIKRFLSDYVLIADGAGEWRGVVRDWKSRRADATERAERGRDYALTRGWETMIEEMSEELSDAGVSAPTE